MNKEIKIVILVVLSLVVNIMAPMLMVDLYKDYTAKSFIVGTPDKVVKIENLDVKDYVFQENLSKMNFVGTQTENEYIFNYYFDARDFDSTTNNYLIYINDYMLSITNLESKSISGKHTRYFKDSNKQICNEVDIEVTFEFYSTYSYLLVKLITPDMSYLNGFRENPGLVLTLSKVNYGMLGNLETYKEVVTLQEQLDELQKKYTELQSQYSSLQGQYDSATSSNSELSTQIAEMEAEIADLQARLEAYDKQNKYEVRFQSEDITQEVALVEVGSKLTTEQVPALSHTSTSHFVGWSLDGTTIVDPTSIDITSNTTFKAVWRTINGTWTISTVDDYYVFDADKIIIINDSGLTATCKNGTEFNLGTGKYEDNVYYGQMTSKEYLLYVYDVENDILEILLEEIGYDNFDYTLQYKDVIVATATRTN